MHAQSCLETPVALRPESLEDAAGSGRLVICASAPVAGPLGDRNSLASANAALMADHLPPIPAAIGDLAFDSPTARNGPPPPAYPSFANIPTPCFRHSSSTRSFSSNNVFRASIVIPETPAAAQFSTVCGPITGTSKRKS